MHSASVKGQRRFLNVHEYISMDLMRKYGVPVPKGAVASTPAEAEALAAKMLSSSGSKYLRIEVVGTVQMPCDPVTDTDP